MALPWGQLDVVSQKRGFGTRFALCNESRRDNMNCKDSASQHLLRFAFSDSRSNAFGLHNKCITSLTLEVVVTDWAAQVRPAADLPEIQQAVVSGEFLECRVDSQAVHGRPPERGVQRGVHGHLGLYLPDVITG